jgi:DNA invertase Pin-like site-specific DNA recombinase
MVERGLRSCSDACCSIQGRHTESVQEPLSEKPAINYVKQHGFRSLQEQIDTTTSGGKLIFHIFASLAEFERDLIRERTNAGLTAARARGRTGGRPKGVDEKKRKAVLALKDNPDYTVQEICTMVGISRNTYYRYIGNVK